MNLGDTYTNLTEIGSGGGGTVYKAYHVRMKKDVVLKKIHQCLQNSTDIRSELDILKNLRHTYLPTVLDFIEDNGAIYTVMDYIPGDSFENLLKQGVQFTQKQVIKYASQLGEVLSYLHHQKFPIIHGDIKPANIMLTPDDNICLIDFNISQLSNHLNIKNMGYTRGYAAPEQIQMGEMVSMYIQRNRADATEMLNSTSEGANIAENANIQNLMDVRTDIYSAGATLYTILCGHKPNNDFNKIIPIEQVIDCQDGLAYVINTCMKIRPEDRFQTADALLKAVSNIAKMDRRYKGLILRQTLAIFTCMIGIAISVLLCLFGFETMKREKRTAYLDIISQMEEENNHNCDYDTFEELYEDALSMNKKYPEAYLQMGQYLYAHVQYEELITYLMDEVLNHIEDFASEDVGGFYDLLASCYMEIGDIDSANLYYSTALKYNSFDCDIYANYAIALAESGELEQADELLEEAVDMGLSNDRMLLTMGEINGRNGLIEEGEKNFKACLEETDDDYVLLRAYIMWSRLYSSPEEGTLNKKAEILETAYNEVAEAYQAMVLEQLAQTYIDLGDLTQNAAYYGKAIEDLNAIIQIGWGNYTTYNNIGILYEKMGSLEPAYDVYNKMLENYGEDYRTYKRLAFLELEMQNEKDVSERNYLSFQEYYQNAKELFDVSGSQKDADMEMQRLDQLYQEVLNGNWLE